MDEADKVELDLKYQKKKVQNLIEGHQERYALCGAAWKSLGGPRHRRDVLPELRLRDGACAMAWQVHAIDAMLSP